ncbi:MAG: TIGR03118 family protein [Pseudomonadota bacterium]
MNFTLKRCAAAAATLGLCAALFACGGSYSSSYPVAPAPLPTPTPVVLPVPAGNYAATGLAADSAATPGYGGETTRQFDSHLSNGWGLAASATSPFWVADNVTSLSSLYDGNGLVQALVVALPTGAKPTGIVFNGTQDFKVSLGALTAVGTFLFSGESGKIFGWASSVDRGHALTMVDNSAAGAVYKGLAIGSFGGANFIYASDFHNGRVDVFDASYKKATLAGSFTDPTLPGGYAPYGIQAIGDKIFVSYARQDGALHDQSAGAGLGMINVFDMGGAFVRHLVLPGGALNAPWGMAKAPAGFGAVGGMLLVSNFGDGKINAFDIDSGALAGALSKADRTPLLIDGIWGIAFGNGSATQPLNTLYFTAGPGRQAQGAFGRIDLK